MAWGQRGGWVSAWEAGRHSFCKNHQPGTIEGLTIGKKNAGPQRQPVW